MSKQALNDKLFDIYSYLMKYNPSDKKYLLIDNGKK